MQVSSSQFLLNSILEERFGLDSFRPQQSEVIASLMSGKHVLALLPTGYGKSLCYQVPSQILPGLTLVVSPLIALMQDQLSGLRRRGIRNATCLNSSIDGWEQEERLSAIERGEVKLLYVAPERFESARFRKLVSSLKVSLVVIDEAHCISQWGHDFRLQYRKLSSYLATMKDATVLALTATATPHVQRDIVRTLGLSRMQIISANFDRPNLRFEVRTPSAGTEKESHLLSLLSKSQGSSIVYTSSRKEAERVASLLQDNSLSACFYHAGLSSSDRHRNQNLFESGRCNTIVSTVAFGMGIDKSDIRTVVHFNVPPSLENYYQEAGRSGRDGESALCSLLYQPKDANSQKWLISRNYPSQEELLSVFEQVHASGLKAVRPLEIAKRTGISDSAVLGGLGLLRELQLVDSNSQNAYFSLASESRPSIDSALLLQRKQQELKRLQQMIDYATAQRCRRASILDYFGQSLPNACSGCDFCDI